MITISEVAGLTTIRIDTDSSSWVAASSGGVPEQVYFGPALSEPSSGLGPNVAHLMSQAMPVAKGSLDVTEQLTLLPEAGTGFLGYPGLQLHRDGEQFTSQLVLDRVERAQTESGDERLTIHCVERLSQFSIQINVDVDHASNVLVVTSVISNQGRTGLAVDWLAAACVALPGDQQEIELFDGRWAQEFRSERYRLKRATLLKENRHGRTSHESFPALLAGEASFDVTRGAVTAAHLGWSGNHRLLLERTRDGRPFAQLGELLAPGEIVLAQGQSYSTPPVYLSQSAAGTNQLMQNFQQHVRTRILRPQLRDKPRPVHFNTWEAYYFDQSQSRTLALVEQAAALGAERFVLDDGWFKGRNGEASGLGDWEVCNEKYPDGLEPVIDAVVAAGMEFGLWIEPEMVNVDSDLYRAHPDWVLADGERSQPLGRGQLVLNLANQLVFDHLLTVIVGLVERYQPSYIKWDMNRDLTHAVIDGRPGHHRFTLAAYRLLAAVRKQCPNTEIEICSSGGARADYGALSHGDRIWTSDNHDPHDRQRIQRGFSLFFPPEIMGAHVGSSPSETTGRRHSMAFRVATALVGHFGVEPAMAAPSAEDQSCLRQGVAYYKQHRNWLHRSRSAFLPHPGPGVQARLQLADDGSRGLLMVAQLTTPRDAIPPRLKLAGLDSAQRYQLDFLDPETFESERSSQLDGELLMQIGIQLPILMPDSALLIELLAT